MNLHLERLNGVAPFLQTPIRRMIEECEKKLRRPLLIVSGWRSCREQWLNYQQGRSYDRDTDQWTEVDPARIVTRAKPGMTPHNVVTLTNEPCSLAVDVIPLNDDGTADWDVELLFWDRLYEIAWKVGLDPLGDMIGAYLRGDRGHFEEPAWKLKLEGLRLQQPGDFAPPSTTV